MSRILGSISPEKPSTCFPLIVPHVDVSRQNVDSANAKYRLDTRLMPEPFGGNRQATLVFLNRNPGLSSGDPRVHHDNQRYVAALRANLGSAADGHQAVGLLPEFKQTPAGRWCRERCFKALINHSHAPEDLALQGLERRVSRLPLTAVAAYRLHTALPALWVLAGGDKRWPGERRS